MESATTARVDEQVFNGKPLFDIDVMQWVSSPGVNNPKTHVSEPAEVTCYSRDDNRDIKYGSREQLCTYSDPRLGSNLGDLIESYTPKAEDDVSTVGVQHILTALLKSSFDVKGQADIVTYRNNLNKIGTAPYENRDGWEFDCVQVDNTVYLDIRKTGGDSSDPSHQRFMYYGYRFESLCTGLAEEPVNANSEFCSVSRLRIANHRILLASEIDCAAHTDKAVKNPVHAYVELKTMKAMQTERALSNMYRHRFLKYWLQSYLAGVRTITLGIRSDSGDLLDVKRMRTRDLPREAREHFERTRAHSRWDPFVCINFLDCVLASIREACAGNLGFTIRVTLNPKTKRVQAKIVAGPGKALSARVVSAIEEHTRRRPEQDDADEPYGKKLREDAG